MVIFATPDFGAGASMACFAVLAWAVVLLFVAAGVVCGARLLKSTSLIARRGGLALLLGSASVPFLCCLGPPCLIRIEYGNYPIGSRPDGKVKEGMTSDEVVAALGTPHERHKEDSGESWYYWLDSYGIGWFGIRFGPDGRVVRTYFN